MGMGYPISYMVSSNQDEEAVSEFLKWTFAQAEMAPPTFIMVDADKAEANAIRAFGSTPVICYFHFCQALKRRLTKTGLGLPESEHTQFWYLVKAAQDEEDPVQFAKKHATLQAFLSGVQGGAEFANYWAENWSSPVMCLTWARIGHRTLKREARTNNLLERCVPHT